MVLISRSEAASLLDVTVRTIDRYVIKGYLTRYKDGVGRTRFDKAQVIKLGEPSLVQ